MEFLGTLSSISPFKLIVFVAGVFFLVKIVQGLVKHPIFTLIYLFLFSPVWTEAIRIIAGYDTLGTGVDYLRDVYFNTLFTGDIGGYLEACLSSIWNLLAFFGLGGDSTSRAPGFHLPSITRWWHNFTIPTGIKYTLIGMGIALLVLVSIYIKKHVWIRVRRFIEDFLKIDPWKESKLQLDIKHIRFKKNPLSTPLLRKKLAQYTGVHLWESRKNKVNKSIEKVTNKVDNNTSSAQRKVRCFSLTGKRLQLYDAEAGNVLYGEEPIAVLVDVKNREVVVRLSEAGSVWCNPYYRSIIVGIDEAGGKVIRDISILDSPNALKVDIEDNQRLRTFVQKKAKLNLIVKNRVVNTVSPILPRITRGKPKEGNSEKNNEIKSVEWYNDRFFIGMTDNKQDITIPTKDLFRHVHVIGPTGTGKTYLGVLPMALQAIGKGYAVVFITFKKDDKLAYILKSAYEYYRGNLDGFMYFSLNKEDWSHMYNPIKTGSTTDIADRLMSALELDRTDAAFYYAMRQKEFVINVVESLKLRGVETITIKDIYQLLREPDRLSAETGIDPKKDRQLLQDITGLRAKLTVYVSSEIGDRLCPKENNKDKEIILQDVVNRKGMVYFNLDTSAGPDIAKGVGRMVAFDLRSLATSRSEKDIPVFMFIDEFQNLACRGFEEMLAVIRAANCSIVIANQGIAQLENVRHGFDRTVFNNTATKIIFGAIDPQDAKMFAEASGTEQYMDKGMSTADITTSGEHVTILDGKRTRRGYMSYKTKAYVHENVFLSLGKGNQKKSVVFTPNSRAVLCNHAFLFEKNEWKKIQTKSEYAFIKEDVNNVEHVV